MPDNPFSSARLWIVCCGMVAMACVLVVRSAQLALNDPYNVQPLGERGKIKPIRLPAERGYILDRHETPLAVNTDTYNIAADLDKIPINDRLAVAEKLAGLLQMKQAPLIRQLTAPNRRTVYLRWQVPLEVVEALRDQPIEGVRVEITRGRLYAKGSLASNLIGYVDRYDMPKSGLEKEYAHEVEGSSVLYEAGIDAWTFARAAMDYTEVARIQGADLILTIDEYLQFCAEQALAHACETHSASGGCAVVLDHRTGDVLALASYPTFNPNQYFECDEFRSFRNLAVEATYEPGSTLKPFTYALALEAGVISPDTLIDCELGTYYWYENGRRHRVRDKSHRFGVMTAEQVIEKSSNVGSAKIAQILAGAKGKEAFRNGLLSFGFGRLSGIGARGELPGVLPPLSEWWPPKLENVAFGQGLTVTAVQVAQAYGVLANGGVMVPPRVILARRSKIDNARYGSPQPAPRRVLSEKTTRLVNRALRMVTQSGTGKKARVEGYSTAGKTGTANKVDPETGQYSTKMIVASFAGFVPADRPAATIVVMVDEPGNEKTYGGDVAAPAWAEIAQAVVGYLGVPADEADLRVADAGRGN